MTAGRGEGPGEGRGEGFLGRWSRLKQQTLEAESTALSAGSLPPDSAVDGLPQEAGEASVSQEPVPQEPLLRDEDMPDLESLDEHSDYTGFLSEGVSEALRRKAMRKLFHLPEFNIRDGLNDYDEDYATFQALGDTVTYQMKQWMERQQQEAAQELEQAPEARPESQPENPVAETDGVSQALVDDWDDEEEVELG